MHTEKYEIKSDALKKMISSCKPGEKIVDYGCGTGNLLRSFKIDPSNYLGIDVDINNVHKAREIFPDYEFTWLNMYNPVYNKNGANLPPLLPNNYFIKGIVAYSVFSHTTEENTIEIINGLIDSILDPNRSYITKNDIELLLSFVTWDNLPMLQYFQHKRLQKYGQCDNLLKTTLENPGTMYLINNRLVEMLKVEEKLNEQGNAYWDNVEEFVPIYNEKDIEMDIKRNIESAQYTWERYKGQQNMLHIKIKNEGKESGIENYV